MIDSAELETAPTIQRLVAELAQLRQRVEDLEDAQELEAAIRRNADKPLIPWESIQSELESE